MLQLNQQTKFPSVFLRIRSLVGCIQSCNIFNWLSTPNPRVYLWVLCDGNDEIDVITIMIKYNQQNTGWWDLFDVRAYHVNVFYADVKYFLNIKQVFTVQTTHLAQLMPSKANLPWFIFSESYSQSVLSMTTHQGVAVREPEIC